MNGGAGRGVLLGAALLGLAAVVGVATRADTPTSGDAASRPFDSGALLQYSMLITGALALVIVPVVLHAMMGSRGAAESPLRRKNWLVRVFVSMAALSMAAAIGLGIAQLRQDDRGPGATVNPGTSTRPYDRTPATEGRPVPFDWVPVIVVGSVAAAGAMAGLAILGRRRRNRLPSADELAADLADALDDSLDDLLAEPDPRRAVVAAYARMERVLAAAGWPRRAAEAPEEYLQRVLAAELGVGRTAVASLTHLYERAKFSVHEIDDGMKESAIAALVALRDELRSLA